MGTSLQRTLAAGLVLALACGGSDKESAADRTAAPPAKRGAGASRPADLCALLTEAEAEAILGKKLEPPQRQANGDCWYLSEGGSDFGDAELVVSILPVTMESERAFDAFIAEQVGDLNEQMKKAGGTGFKAERVGEVQTPAYYVDPSLFVLRAGPPGAPPAMATEASA